MNLLRFVFLAGLLGLLSSVRANTITFTDSFNGSAVDTSHWIAGAPFSDSSVNVAGGNAVLTNHGTMLSTNTYSTPTDITMAFQFTGGSNDSFKLVTRSSGVSTNSNDEFDNGIVASFRMQSDGGDTSGNVWLYDENLPNATSLALGTFAMTQNQTYLIRLLDDGTNLSLFINDLANPFLTASSTSSYGGLIGFDNREGAGDGSGISAGSQVSVDFVSITSHVPDSSTTILYLAIGICATLFLPMGNTKRTSCFWKEHSGSH